MENEAMVQGLYDLLEIPLPSTQLLGLDHLLFQGGGGGRTRNTSPYLLQVSQAVPGISAKALFTQEGIGLQGPPVFTGLNGDLYARQVIGALLTHPEDGKADNFIYNPDTQSLTSIDNDDVFATPFHRDGTAQVKSLLYLLPQMDEIISDQIRVHFETIVPEVLLLGWLRRLTQHNNSWQQLKRVITFQTGENWLRERIPPLDLPLVCYEQPVWCKIATKRGGNGEHVFPFSLKLVGEILPPETIANCFSLAGS